MAEVQRKPEHLMIKQVEGPFFILGSAGIFMCTNNEVPETETQVNAFIQTMNISKALSVIQFRSKNPVINNQKLNIYLVSQQEYENPNIIENDNIYLISNTDFIQRRDRKVLLRYQDIMTNTYQKPNAQVQTFKDQHGHDIFMIGVK
jgi:hypothetical protein